MQPSTPPLATASGAAVTHSPSGPGSEVRTGAAGLSAGGGGGAAPRTLLLVRHGESVWNLANRFTGWTDVDLTAQGRRQARLGGALLRAHGYRVDLAFTSVLKRAIRTLHILEDEMDILYTPEVKSWRLNERHYGALQGLNKAEMAAKHGAEMVHIWRRSFGTQPPALSLDDPRHPRYDVRYRGMDEQDLPCTESLKDCIARTLPFWSSDIAPAVRSGKRVLVVAHGNSLRGVVKHLDGISDEEIMMLEIPVGVPLVYELDEQLKPLRHYYLGLQLVAAPPLDVTALPPPLSTTPPPADMAPASPAAATPGTVSVPAGATAAQAAPAEFAAAVPEGEAELQALMQALVSCGATTADHVHNAATASALVGDLAAAEDLLLRGSMAAAKYVFGHLSPAAVAAAAAESASDVLGPARLAAQGQTPEEGLAVVGAGYGSRAFGPGGARTGSETVASALAAFKRAAPLMDEEKHVLVGMAAPPPRMSTPAGVEGGRMAASSLAASLLAVVGADKKVVLAMPSCGGGGSEMGSGGGSGGAASMPPWWSCLAAWQHGGCVWAIGGVADGSEAQLVAEALTCATGSIWKAALGKI